MPLATSPSLQILEQLGRSVFNYGRGPLTLCMLQAISLHKSRFGQLPSLLEISIPFTRPGFHLATYFMAVPFYGFNKLINGMF